MSDAGLSAFTAAVTYPGYRVEDHAHSFSRFLAPLDRIRSAELRALHAEPLNSGLFQTFNEIPAALSAPGYLPIETGWTVFPNGSAVVAVHTPMPGVSPIMWDWWFSWHGSDAARYKLWHPDEHLFAIWKDGDGERPGRRSYVGRVSLIKEFIGETYLEGALHFVPPESLGFEAGTFRGTVICGRAGEVHVPVEHTWIIHQVRETPEGAEMRSRFYLGESPRNSITGESLQPVAAKAGPKPLELLGHCAEEMHHLAQFLPELYRAFAAS